MAFLRVLDEGFLERFYAFGEGHGGEGDGDWGVDD
jgi:hypothetical protein